MGKTDVGAGVRIDASIDAFQSTADLNLVKKNCVGNSCTKETQSLGQFGLETKSPLKVLLETKAGLFNQNETAHLNFQLQNAKISHGLGKHQLSMHDFNFNFATDGYMFIDRYRDWETDRKSTRLNSSHSAKSRMPSSA